MLVLTDIDEEFVIDVVANSAVDVYASFNDIGMPNLTLPQPGNVSFTALRSERNSLGGPPTLGYVRQYKSIYVVNRHVSAGANVTMLFIRGSEEYQIKKYTLTAGQHASYIDGVGFTWFTSTGAPVAPV